MKSLALLLVTWMLALTPPGRAAATGPAPAAPTTPAPSVVSTTHGPWLIVDLGLIGTASEDVLTSALAQVSSRHYGGLVIQLDTPGGALDSTRRMVKMMMAATFPVVVWVGPAGARAGSAGAFLTLAANIAAMAPGTNIGASHPVGSKGQDIGKEMNRKVTNDTVAFALSVAKARGRNADMARSFIVTSTSITAEEALANHVVDLLAPDLTSLMRTIDGRVVELQPGIRARLATKDATLITYQKSFRQRLLEVLSNPNLFYLLFLGGLIGISFEITHPGLVLPGVVGAICLILALIATSVLPISWGAAALILAAMIMFVAEAFMPTYGSLAVGGLIALVLGSVFLVDPADVDGLRISWFVIAPGAITTAGAFIVLGYLVLKSRYAPVRSGREDLTGRSGTALEDFQSGFGQTRVYGTIWNARVRTGENPTVHKGDRLVVVAVDGLLLEVTKQDG